MGQYTSLKEVTEWINVRPVRLFISTDGDNHRGYHIPPNGAIFKTNLRQQDRITLTLAGQEKPLIIGIQTIIDISWDNQTLVLATGVYNGNEIRHGRYLRFLRV